MLGEYRAYMAQSDMLMMMIVLASGAIAMMLHGRKLPHIAPTWGVLGFALIIRLLQLDQSLWYDETFTRAVVSLPFDQLHRVILSDVHPPLMYLPQWVSVNLLGQSDLALRLPSLIFGMGSIALIMHIAKHWGLPHIWAGVLLSANMGHVYYSAEARGYALLGLLVLVGVWALSTKRPALFVLVGLAPLVHAVGFVYLVILSIFALSRKWFGVLVIAWVIGGLWLPITLYQSQDVADGFWLGFNIWQSYEYVLTPISQMPDAMVLILVPFTSGLVLYSFWRGATNPLTSALVWGVPLALMIISVVWKPVFLIRALLPSSMLFGLLASPLPRVRLGLLVVCGVSVIYSFAPDYQRFDIRGMVANCEGASHIYVTSTALTIQAQAYALPHQQVITYHTPNDLNQSLSWDARDALGFVYQDPTSLDDVCIIHQVNPMVTEGQIAHINKMVKPQPHTTIKNKWSTISIYRIGG